jgi:phenylalanyl-tRNA synthetase beta chain
VLVPLSWLRDFAPFEGDPSDLARTFDDLGMVVEGIRRIGDGLDGVVVAKVLEVNAIPKADKIRHVVVDDGSGAPVNVVCGAWNFDAGATVAFARVGAVLPGGFEIGRRKMRGVESNGMICSTRELELGDDHSGIMVLPDGLTPGTPLADALGIEPDVVFDLAIEGNRPDAMCIAGVARDAAAALELPFAIPTPPALVPDDSVGVASVVVDSPGLCPRFTATVIDGVRVGPSPEWMARRLTLAGMRPISNVVDASNYVMLELGQPTHPYDLDRLPGRGFVVRAAEPGETLVTLDDVERKLGDGPFPDCLICDAEGTPVGIGGVMGGASSEISESTKRVVLEAAYFDRMAIARTSKRIGLRSEASARFERGCDPLGIDRAVARFVELLGGSPRTGPFVDVRDDESMPAPPRIALRTSRVNALLGTTLTDAQVREALEPIGFSVSAVSEGVQDVVAPTFRPDIEGEVDLIEEVARHHGYARIPRTVPSSPHVGGLTPYQRERRFVRDVLCGLGLSEAVGPMLVGPGDHARAGLAEGAADVIEADDPLAREESILRTSMLPGLLRAVAFNAGHRNAEVWFFEIGHVYRRAAEADAPLPDERERLAFALAGTGGDVDARTAAGVFRSLCDALRVDVALTPATAPGLHPTRTAMVGEGIGYVGEVDPAVLDAHAIDGRVGWCEVELPALLALPRRSDEMAPVSRYPSSDLDLAFAVPDAVVAADVEATIRSAAGALLEWVRLFDVFRGGGGLGEGERSLAFRLRLRALDRTLTEDELASLRRAVVDAVESRHSARLRA